MAAETFSIVLELDGRQVQAQATRLAGSTGFGGLQGSIRRAGRLLATFGAGFSIGAIVSGIVKITASFEQLHAQLVTVVGSTGAASAAFDTLVKFAAKTPFEIRELVSGFTQLVARGFEPTIRNMTAIGNLAGAMGRDFGSALNAITQAAFGETESIKSFGVLMRQQLDNVTIRFKGASQTVKRDADTIFKSLVDLAEANFAGGMERQSKTFLGAVSNMKDAVSVLANSIGQSLVPQIGVAVRAWTEWAAAIDKWVANSGGVTSVADAQAAAIMSTAEALSFANRAIAKNVEILPKYKSQLEGALAANHALAVEIAGRLADAQELANKGILFQIELVRKLKTELSTLNRERAVLIEGLERIGSSSISAAMQDQLDKLRAQRETLEGTLKVQKERLAIAKKESEEFAKQLTTLERFLDAIADRREALAEIAPIGLSSIEPLKIELLTDEEFDEAGRRMGFAYIGVVGREIPRIMTLAGAALADALFVAAAGAGQILADGIRNGFGSAEETATASGEVAGVALGTAVNAFAPGWGTIVGNIAGAILGKVLGSFFSSAPKVLGTIGFGPGGGALTGSQTETGQQAIDFFNEIIRQIEQVTGATVGLVDSLEIALDDAGNIIVSIFDDLGNRISQETFTDFAKAIEFALTEVLKTADLGPMQLAFQELIQNATGTPQELLERLIFVKQLGAELNRMGNSAMQAAQSIKDTLRGFGALRSQLEAMGLSAEALAPLLEQIAAAEAARIKELQGPVLQGIVDVMKEMGREGQKARMLQARADQIAFQIKVQELRLSAKLLGLFKEIGRQFFRDATRFGKDIENFVRSAGRTLSGVGRSVASDFSSAADAARSIGSSIREADAALRRPTGISARPFKDLQAGIRNFTRGLFTGAQSPFSVTDRLAKSMARFQSTIALANTGNRFQRVAAGSQLQALAQETLGLGGDVFGTASAQFKDLFEEVTRALAAFSGLNLDTDPVVTTLAAQRADIRRNHQDRVDQTNQTNETLTKMEIILRQIEAREPALAV